MTDDLTTHFFRYQTKLGKITTANDNEPKPHLDDSAAEEFCKQIIFKHLKLFEQNKMVGLNDTVVRILEKEAQKQGKSIHEVAEDLTGKIFEAFDRCDSFGRVVEAVTPYFNNTEDAYDYTLHFNMQIDLSRFVRAKLQFKKLCGPSEDPDLNQDPQAVVSQVKNNLIVMLKRCAEIGEKQAKEIVKRLETEVDKEIAGAVLNGVGR